MPFDLTFWKQWEGQDLDGRFPLIRCIGATGLGAVFETEFEQHPAAVKVIGAATRESAEAQHQLWVRAATLAHPALLRIFACGRASLGDTSCAYGVMERADDNLAELLRERPLTPGEARDMLVPLLGALRYLHAQGFAHGAVRPSNVMAVGDQLKIAIDRLSAGGDPRVDCRAIGTLLEEALGAGRDDLRRGDPLAAIIRSSGTAGLDEIESYLRGGGAATPRRIRWGGLALAAALAGVGLVAFRPWQTEREVAPPPAVIAPAKARPSASPPALPSRRLPDIPQVALNTITGRIRINVRVQVDAEGRVVDAALEPPPASAYFTSRALAAVRTWKFAPGDASSSWLVRFELTRERVSLASAARDR